VQSNSISPTAPATLPPTTARPGFAPDLGFDKARSQTRVVVAMSGGVDSSVVAALLAEAGYDVVGVTLQLYDHGAAVARRGACCAGRDIHDARRVAERIGFPHYVLDYEDRFRESVVEDFADAYLAGATPVPCIRCNERVKFRDLLETALELEADCLATGHYVRRVAGPAGSELHAGADPARDQSYFLFATTRIQLDRLRFPLGGIASKAETRALAARYGLPVADKPDSQDICFVPNGNYAAVIEKLRPGAVGPGEIVDTAGRVLGRHEGVIRYTVGQRRGLGIGGTSEPLYVLRLDAANRRVVVGPRSALAVRTVALDGVNWLGDGAFGDAPADGWEVRVRVRSTRPPVPARLHPAAGGGARVELLGAEESVAPGQACVFYAPEGSRVLGGGWIRSRTAPAP
jgi:tRNA-uridine 2-sulfurtransferase